MKNLENVSAGWIVVSMLNFLIVGKKSQVQIARSFLDIRRSTAYRTWSYVKML